MNFVNPYNFLPAVEVQDDPETVRLFLKDGPHFQERFREDTHSGRVVCEISAKTDIFIGAGKEKKEDCRENSNTPATLKGYELNGKAAIPPSTLKGMLSSVMEAASNSALRVLDEKTYSRRQEFGTDILNKIGLVVSVPRYDGYYILPLKTGEVKKSQTDFPAYTPTAIDSRYPIYIDGYNHQNKEFDLLRNYGNLKDFSADQRYYYLDIRQLKNKVKKRGRNNFFLGYELRKINVFPFITPDEYGKKTEQDKLHYRSGIFKILGIGSHRQDKIPTNKGHEFFLFAPLTCSMNQLLPLREAIEEFEFLSDDRASQNDPKDPVEARLPFSPKGRQRDKKEGKDALRIRPNDVVYYEEECGRVTKVSFSACWRDFCGSPGTISSAYDYFKLVDRNGMLLPPCLVNQGKTRPEELRLTPTSTLLGFVEEEKLQDEKIALALAGRLFFSPGILSPDQDSAAIRRSEKTLKILASPKPPCPEFYFHREDRSGNFIAKSELKPDGRFMPNGRKFYWHNPTPSPYVSDEKREQYEKDYCKQIVRIKPIREKRRFLFCIDFFNLTEFELGMLLYSLHPNGNFMHNLGMGKPLGMGSIQIDTLNLLFVNRKERYENDPFFSNQFFHTQTGTVGKRLGELADIYSQSADKQASFESERFCSQIKKEAQNNMEHFVSQFKKKIHELYANDWLVPLENIGNLTATEGLDVRYPPNPDNNSEKEIFKWWVLNAHKEKGQKKTLSRVPETPEHKAGTLPNNPGLRANPRRRSRRRN